MFAHSQTALRRAFRSKPVAENEVRNQHEMTAEFPTSRSAIIRLYSQGKVYAVSTALPFALRRASTLRPFFVDMRFMKPCSLDL